MKSEKQNIIHFFRVGIIVLLLLFTSFYSFSQPLTPQDFRTRYYLMAARAAWEQQDYGKAFELFYFLHTLNPKDAVACRYLAMLSNGETQMEWISKAYENDPLAYWEEYMNALASTKQWEEAEKVVLKETAVHPKNGKAWNYVATIRAQQNNAKGALKALQKQEEAEGLTEEIVSMRTSIYAALGKVKEAAKEIDRYQMQHPEDEQFLTAKAKLYLQVGQYPKARTELERIEQLQPQNAFVQLSWADYYHTVHNSLKEAQAVQKAMQMESWYVGYKIFTFRRKVELLDRMGLADELLANLLKDNPHDENVLELHLDYAVAHRQTLQARQALRQLTEANPQNGDYWQRWLDILMSDGENHQLNEEEVQHVVNEGYKVHAPVLRWTLLKALLCMEKKDTTTAILILKHDLAQQTKATESTASAWAVLGDLYMQQDSIDACFAAYDEALKYDPDRVSVLNNYAYQLAITGGDLKKAEKMSQKTISKEPNNATYLDTYAWILYLQGQKALAAFYIRKAKENMDDREAPEIMEHYKTIIEE